MFASGEGPSGEGASTPAGSVGSLCSSVVVPASPVPVASSSAGFGAMSSAGSDSDDASSAAGVWSNEPGPADSETSPSSSAATSRGRCRRRPAPSSSAQEPSTSDAADPVAASTDGESASPGVSAEAGGAAMTTATAAVEAPAPARAAFSCPPQLHGRARRPRTRLKRQRMFHHLPTCSPRRNDALMILIGTSRTAARCRCNRVSAHVSGATAPGSPTTPLRVGPAAAGVPRTTTRMRIGVAGRVGASGRRRGWTSDSASALSVTARSWAARCSGSRSRA